MAAAAHQARTSSAVQQTAAELLPTTPDLGRGMAEHLAAAIPEIAAIDDDDLRAELLASAEANVESGAADARPRRECRRRHGPA